MVVFVLFEFENSGFAVPGDIVLRSGCIYGYALKDATKSSIWMMKNITSCRISGLVGILPVKACCCCITHYSSDQATMLHS